MTLDLIPGVYAVCRLPAGSALPPWASSGAFSSVTRTPDELSIVCASDDVPADVQAERGYRALSVRGPLEFGAIGILATLSAALADAAISIFVVSTYDTDYLFVRAADLDHAIAALGGAGHTVAVGY